MDISARIDPEDTDENGNYHSVFLTCRPTPDGGTQSLHATISPEYRAVATALAKARPEPNRLRQLRRERGLTQIQLAAAAGVSQSQLCHWEAGRFKPMLGSATALAVALTELRGKQPKVSVKDLGTGFYGEE